MKDKRFFSIWGRGGGGQIHIPNLQFGGFELLVANLIVLE
jgi:hypothetical protein